MTSMPASRTDVSADAELVRRALARDRMAVRTIAEQNNRRLYRIARDEKSSKIGVP